MWLSFHPDIRLDFANTPKTDNSVYRQLIDNIISSKFLTHLLCYKSGAQSGYAYSVQGHRPVTVWETPDPYSLLNYKLPISIFSIFSLHFSPQIATVTWLLIITPSHTRFSFSQPYNPTSPRLLSHPSILFNNNLFPLNSGSYQSSWLRRGWHCRQKIFTVPYNFWLFTLPYLWPQKLLPFTNSNFLARFLDATVF